MSYIMLAEAMEQVGWDQQIDALSVYRAFEQVEGKRRKRGARYSLASQADSIPPFRTGCSD